MDRTYVKLCCTHGMAWCQELQWALGRPGVCRLYRSHRLPFGLTCLPLWLATTYNTLFFWKNAMLALTGLLLSICMAFNVRAMTTVRLNQVYWNDPRVSYSSQRSGLSNVGWESYNAIESATGDVGGAYPSTCDGGAMAICSEGDTASLIFNGEQKRTIIPCCG